METKKGPLSAFRESEPISRSLPRSDEHRSRRVSTCGMVRCEAGLHEFFLAADQGA